jgi:hypothetical protein
VRPATLRTIAIVAAALLLGSVALAIAVGVRPPSDTQIPTVVTNQPTASPVVQPRVTTRTPPSQPLTATIATPPSPGPSAQNRQTSGTDAIASDREVVTPSVRDDGDDDEDDRDGGAYEERSDDHDGERDSDDRKSSGDDHDDSD